MKGKGRFLSLVAKPFLIEERVAIVMSKAGTGKLTIIHKMTRHYGQDNEMFDIHGIKRCIENNIGGQTLRSGLHLIISRNQLPLTGDKET